ncbi:hypothetical protein [Brevundimonas diminuta]|uniref:hypothetical protein n=1 Tax=Brevundimonas diminuta TaxID=293 RepID=UPI0030F67A31
MTADLSALIARLEAAEVGSRELDAHVEVAARAFEAAKTGLSREHWAKWVVSRDFWVEDEHTAYQPTPVTTSLDAALALAERLGLDVAAILTAAVFFASQSGAKINAALIAKFACIAILRAKQGEG